MSSRDDIGILFAVGQSSQGDFIGGSSSDQQRVLDSYLISRQECFLSERMEVEQCAIII